MKYLKTFENHNNKTIAYHVTDRKNLPSILENGIEPRVPEDYGENGDVKGVYLFKDRDDMTNAMRHWFGERIEEIEEETNEIYEEIELVVDITGLDMFDSVEFEWTVLELITPDRIIKVIDGVYDEQSMGKILYEK